MKLSVSVFHVLHWVFVRHQREPRDERRGESREGFVLRVREGTLRERFSVDVSSDDAGRVFVEGRLALHERALVREFHPDGRVVGGRGVPRAFYDVQGLVHAAVRVDEKVAAQTALVVKRAKTIAGTFAPVVVHDQLRQRALEVRGARHQLAVRTADATSTVPRDGDEVAAALGGERGRRAGRDVGGKGRVGIVRVESAGVEPLDHPVGHVRVEKLAGDGDLVAVAGMGGRGVCPGTDPRGARHAARGTLAGVRERARRIDRHSTGLSGGLSKPPRARPLP